MRDVGEHDDISGDLLDEIGSDLIGDLILLCAPARPSTPSTCSAGPGCTSMLSTAAMRIDKERTNTVSNDDSADDRRRIMADAVLMDFDLKSYGYSAETAQLAAGALIHGVSLLVDRLFQDLKPFMRSRRVTNPTVESLSDTAAFMILDDLPDTYTHLYDQLFVQKFLVSAIALTGRIANGLEMHPGSPAEELALALWLTQAETALDTHGLLDDDTRGALGAFAEATFEDLDHEVLYSPELELMHGIPGEYAFESWFVPFLRHTHPYATDPDSDPEASD